MKIWDLMSDSPSLVRIQYYALGVVAHHLLAHIVDLRVGHLREHRQTEHAFESPFAYVILASGVPIFYAIHWLQMDDIEWWTAV